MVMWLSFGELSQYLKTLKSTLYKLLAAGKLPGAKVGRSYRFDRDEVDQFLKHRSSTRRKKVRQA